MIFCLYRRSYLIDIMAEQFLEMQNRNIGTRVKMELYIWVCLTSQIAELWKTSLFE